MRIPLSAPDIGEREIQAVVGVLRTPQLSLGPKLPEFEQRLATYIGAPHAVAVSSGTAGLHLCVRALGIGAGDEVIVPSFSFIAVANVLRYENAVPVFVDIERETLNLDPARIEEAVTPRTKAILLVHTFGVPAALSDILEIANRRRLLVIEDACEAIGAEYHGQKVGAFGDAGVFAFYPNKQITTGEGGTVVTRSAELAARIRALRNQGRAPSDGWFQHSEIGYNYRISEINCVLGIAQLERIDSILTLREEVARTYQRNLSSLPGLRLPVLEMPSGKISWFVYVVRLAESFSQEQRDWIVSEMNRRGISCGRYFAPIHLQPAYQKQPFNTRSLRVTEHEAARCIALPFFNQIGNDEISEVCGTLGELVRSAAASQPDGKTLTAPPAN
jgi:perosamine synthetase